MQIDPRLVPWDLTPDCTDWSITLLVLFVAATTLMSTFQLQGVPDQPSLTNLSYAGRFAFLESSAESDSKLRTSPITVVKSPSLRMRIVCPFRSVPRSQL